MHDDFISQEDFMPYKPMPTSDPAYWMLERGNAEASGHAPDTGWVTKTHDNIYKASCYICRDPEFALMGMPVCKPCPMCGVHWAADDSICDNGCDVMDGIPFSDVPTGG